MSRPGPDDFRGTSRFAIERRLGAGAFGVVYRAHDREHDQVVALKALREAEPDAIFRFKNEFRSLADLSHPNLVTLFELFVEEHHWFFTMELVAGVSFVDYVRDASAEAPAELPSDLPTLEFASGDLPARSDEGAPRPLGRTSLKRLRGSLRQLADGLATLHRAGKLHRDVKPSNALVSSEGRVVLLDFGLVTELACPAGDLGATFHVAGTPAYMSPEQWQGVPATASADWYSVGVMLYECLAGCHPFPGVRQAPPLAATPPALAVEGLPEDLVSLCEDLLGPDPEARPESEEILDRLSGSGAGSPRTAAPPVDSDRLPLVGRERELGQLDAAYGRMKAGQAGTVFVHGPSGIGKSALVERFLERLHRDGDAVILRGRCYERESLPYKALDSVIDALSRYLGRLPPAECEGLLPRDVLALAQLFPVLRRVERVAKAERRVLDTPNPHELRRRGFSALRELLARLSDRRPLVVYVDDLQWGDVDSAPFVASLLRPPDPPALLLIGCYRSEDVETSPFLTTLLASDGASDAPDNRCSIAVGELAPAEAEALAIELLERIGRRGEGPQALIARESSGSPFFVHELVRHAEETGLAGGTSGDLSLQSLLGSRLGRLSAPARSLLEVVALAGQPVPLQIAAEAARLEGEHDRALALLRSGSLVRTRTTAEQIEIETYHDRIRETVVASLAPDTSREHHRKLARALESSGGADPEMLAVHFHGAGEVQRAGEHAVVAADRAAEALAFDRAAELYRLALDSHATESAETHRLRARLADALANAGHPSEAADAYGEAGEGATGLCARDIERRQADQLFRAGRNTEGKAVLTQVLRQFGIRLPRTSVGVLAWALYWQLRARLAGLRLRASEDLDPEQRLLLDTLRTATACLNQLQPLFTVGFSGRAHVLAQRVGALLHFSIAVNDQACATAWQGGRRNDRRALALSRHGLELAERTADPIALGQAWAWHGACHGCAGRWKDALGPLDRGERIWREQCANVTWELGTARYVILFTLLNLGEVQEIRRRLPAYVEQAEELGDTLGSVLVQSMAGYVPRLAADDPEGARLVLQSVLDRWTQPGFGFVNVFHLASLTETDLYHPRAPAARQRLLGRWPALRKSLLLVSQAWRICFVELRARSAVAAAVETDGSAADALLRAAEADARALEREHAPWATALAGLLRTGVAATRARREEAAARLVEVEAELESADMTLRAAVAKRRRGEVLGGDEGAELVRQADAVMADQDIRNPTRWAAMLAPGRWAQ